MTIRNAPFTTLLLVLVLAVDGQAQEIDPARGVDAAVDYASLTRFGPWDDRNYQLTSEDLALLAPDEHELRVAIPAFYRVELRRQFPGMLRSGPLQYPHSALLAFMHAHGGLLVDGMYYAAAKSVGDRWQVAMDKPIAVPREGGGVEPLDGDTQISTPGGGRETAIEINPVNADVAVASAVIWPINTRQEMFYSRDGGVSWNPSEALPLGGALGDPTVAWSADGSLAYTASLSFFLDTLYFYRSGDGGRTWDDLASEPGNDPRREVGGDGADKEYLHVDQSPTSPFQDNIYMAWDNFNQANTMKFARSSDFGNSWTVTSFNSEPAGLATDLTTDASGKIYYFYPAFNERTIRVLTSTDGGVSFGPGSVVADTEASVFIFIPAQETRGAVVYATADADRSDGPFADNVYVAWNDTNAGRAVIKVAISDDGGTNWTVRVPHVVDGDADRFFPWLEVDDDGNVHVIYYDTRDDPTRQSVHVYHSISADGGQSWSGRRLTAQNSVGPDDGFDFGDYNGMSITMDRLIAAFADNRDSSVDMWASGEILGAPYTLQDTDPGQAGEVNTWTIENGTPNAPHAILGGSEGSSTISVGGCKNIGIDLQVQRLVGSGTADAAGNLIVSRTIPQGAEGATFLFQALDATNCRLSNPVTTAF